MAKVFLKPSDPLLRKVAKEIPSSKISSNEVKKIIQKMLKIAFGEQDNPNKPVMVGLAAVQIGIARRIILVDINANGKGKVGDLKVFINPQLIWKSKRESKWYEGCYSIPEVCGIVSRSTTIKIKAISVTPAARGAHPMWNTKEVEEKYTGYVARIFQHEIDHLDGKFFVDRIKNPNNLHHVKPSEFPSYRNKQGWRNWPKKHPLPLA